MIAGRLLHYSSKPLPRLVSMAPRLNVDMKPQGLWLSVEGKDDWLSWCESEGFRPDALTHVHEIVLQPNAKILRLTSAIGIDILTRRYGRPIHPSLRTLLAVDWPAIGKLYDGIIIAPYQWSRRLNGEARWYYGWDCASGCIWRPRAIAEIKALPDEAEKAA